MKLRIRHSCWLLLVLVCGCMLAVATESPPPSEGLVDNGITEGGSGDSPLATATATAMAVAELVGNQQRTQSEENEEGLSAALLDREHQPRYTSSAPAETDEAEALVDAIAATLPALDADDLADVATVAIAHTATTAHPLLPPPEQDSEDDSGDDVCSIGGQLVATCPVPLSNYTAAGQQQQQHQHDDEHERQHQHEQEYYPVFVIKSTENETTSSALSTPRSLPLIPTFADWKAEFGPTMSDNTRLSKRQQKLRGQTNGRINSIALECGAKILTFNPEAASVTSVQVELSDRYMLNLCSAPKKWIDFELCDEILVDTVVLANFELFSSSFKDIRILASATYPPRDWTVLGSFVANNTRSVQVFPIADPIIWARYVRIEFHTHYGREFYCPLSLVRVHGITMMEDYRDEILDMLVDNDDDDDDDVSRAAAAEDEQQRMESETLKIDAVAEIASDYMRNFGLMRSEALRLLSRALQSVADLFDIVDGTATAEHVLGKEAAAPSPKPSNQPPLIGSSRRQNPPQPQMQTRSSSTSSAPTVPPSAATVTTSPNGQHEHRPSGTSNPKRSAAMSPSLDQLRQFAASPRALIEFMEQPPPAGYDPATTTESSPTASSPESSVAHQQQQQQQQEGNRVIPPPTSSGSPQESLLAMLIRRVSILEYNATLSEAFLKHQTVLVSNALLQIDDDIQLLAQHVHVVEYHMHKLNETVLALSSQKANITQLEHTVEQLRQNFVIAVVVFSAVFVITLMLALCGPFLWRLVAPTTPSLSVRSSVTSPVTVASSIATVSHPAQQHRGGGGGGKHKSLKQKTPIPLSVNDQVRLAKLAMTKSTTASPPQSAPASMVHLNNMLPRKKKHKHRNSLVQKHADEVPEDPTV